MAHGEAHVRVGPLSARLKQVEGSHELDVPTTTGVCITDPETGLTHVDVPGLLHVSFRQEEPARPLYARTTLLERLGTAGGRYELAGCELR